MAIEACIIIFLQHFQGQNMLVLTQVKSTLNLSSVRVKVTGEEQQSMYKFDNLPVSERLIDLYPLTGYLVD